MRSVAFLGMGVMGAPMAANLVKAGFAVRVWNRTQTSPRLAQAVKAGATGCASIAEAIEGVSLILICVGDVPDVESVLFGEGGVAEHGKQGSLVIDFSTIGPMAAKDFHKRLAERGLRFMDAPVSGGDVGAIKGTLTVMLGGDAADLQEARPALDAVGKNLFHCGPAGSGQAVKLCNQVLCGGHMVALTEAMLLAESQGLDPHLMVKVCSTGAAGSWALSNLGPMIADNRLQPAFMIEHMLKDLRLALEAIKAGEIDAPGTLLAERLFQETGSLDGGEAMKLGTQAMIRAYRKKKSG